VQAVDPEIAQKEAVRAKLENLRATVANADQKPKLDKAIALLDQVSGSKAAQDQFVSLALSLWDNSDPDPTEGGDRIQRRVRCSDKLRVPIIVSPAAHGREAPRPSRPQLQARTNRNDGGLGSFWIDFGRIGQFLNLTTWYVMKNRAGGRSRSAQAVRDEDSQSCREDSFGGAQPGRTTDGGMRQIAGADQFARGIAHLT
jgi:hypothetical protein